MSSGRRAVCDIRSLVNTRVLKLEYARVCLLLCMVVRLWKERERSRISAVLMDNRRGMLGIRRMDKLPNAQIRELGGVMKEVDKRIDEGFL